MRKPILLLCGLPGVGKTTVANYLTDQLGFYHYRTEDIRNLLGFDVYDESQKTLVREKMKELAYQKSIGKPNDLFLSNNHGIIFDANHAERSSREWIYEFASIMNLEVILLYLSCSEETSLQRMTQRPNAEGLVTSPNDPAVYYKVKNRFEDPNIDVNQHKQLFFLGYDSDIDTLEKLVVDLAYISENKLPFSNLYYLTEDIYGKREIGPEPLDFDDGEIEIIDERIINFGLRERVVANLYNKGDEIFFAPSTPIYWTINVDDQNAKIYLAMKKGRIAEKIGKLISVQDKPLIGPFLNCFYNLIYGVKLNIAKEPIQLIPGRTTISGYTSTGEFICTARIGSP